MTDFNELNDLMNTTDLGTMVEKLKSNPEIVNSVASALGLDGAKPDEVKPTEGNSGIPGSIPEMVSALAPLLSSKSDGTHGDAGNDHRLALLCALRPYLSPERQEIIDYIMKFSKIGDLLKKLQ